MDEVPAIVRHGVIGAELAERIAQAEAIAARPNAPVRDKEAYVSLVRDACRGNYPLFFYLVMGRDPTPHFWGMKEDFDRYRLILLEASRGFSKTESVTICEAVHDLCYASLGDPAYADLTNLSIFETETKAQERMNGIKSIIENSPQGSLLRACFGDVRSRASQWNESGIDFPGFEGRIQPLFRAIGAGSAVVGAHVKKLRGDDLVSPKNSDSKKKRENLWRWWSLSINPIIKSSTNVRLVFTPYWEDDIHGRLKATKAFRSLRLPCMNAVPRRGEDYTAIEDENGTAHVQVTPLGYSRLASNWPCPLGELRCPGTEAHFREVGYHRPLRELCEIHYRDPITFLSQMMLLLQSEQGTRFKPEMLRFWVPRGDPRVGTVAKWHMHLDEDERPRVVAFPDPSDVLIHAHCTDHSIGKKAAHDYTSTAFVYRTKTNDVFAAWKRGRWDFQEAVKRMIMFYKTDLIGRPPRYIGSEAISFQRAYSETIEKSKEIPPGVICPMMGNRCERIGLDGLGSTADKDALLVDSGLLHHGMAGKLFLPLDDEAGVNQVLSFTPAQDQAHDDDVDALRGGFNLVKARRAQPPTVLNFG